MSQEQSPATHSEARPGMTYELNRVHKAWCDFINGVEVHPGSTAEAQIREVDEAIIAATERNVEIVDQAQSAPSEIARTDDVKFYVPVDRFDSEGEPLSAGMKEWLSTNMERYVTERDYRAVCSALFRKDAELSESAAMVRLQQASMRSTTPCSDDAENAARWRDACMDPLGYVHLFQLLADGKGTVKSLNVMADRIGASRRAAIEKGLGSGVRPPLKGAKP